MKGRLKILHQRKIDLVSEGDAILQLAEDEARELSEEETRRFEAIDTDIKVVDETIQRESQQLERKASLIGFGENVQGDDLPEQQRIVVGRDLATDKPFESFGHQLQAIANDAINRGSGRDPRLIWAAAQGAGEGVPSEGGFLVQRDFSTALLDRMNEMGAILSRVSDIPISGNSNGIKLPYVDETSRANGSRFGGVQAYWQDEGVSPTATQAKFGAIELDLKKLIAISYATEELLADSAALESVLGRAFAEELLFKFEDSVVNGTGSGQPLGILNSGAAVSVAKESGQAASTVVVANVVNMAARLSARARRRAVWLVNQDAFPQLWQMTIGSGTAVALLYRPATGLPGDANLDGTLAGVPVVRTEYNATLGTVGDIILCDLGAYLKIEKGGQRIDRSMHVRYLTDEMTFRFVWRVDGQPSEKSPVTPKNGTNTQSSFITLATRS